MEERNSVVIHDNEQVGQVKIADEVVAIIAGLAANEVNGVSCIGSSMVGKKNKRNFSKGIQIDIADNEVICDVDVYINYGVIIPDISFQIQQKVKVAIENMTDLTVKEVNIHILGIQVNKDQEVDKVDIDFNK